MSVIGQAKERVGLRKKRITKDEDWYSRTFLVKCTSTKDDSNVVERAFGLPKYGFAYVTSTSVHDSALCYSISSEQITHKDWQVTCEYSTDPSKFGLGDEKDKPSPEFEAPTYEWGGYQIREVVTGQSTFIEYQDPSQVIMKDSTGILNSAYEPYNPPAEMDRFIPTLTFERNEPYFNHRNMLFYVNSVNNRVWNGWKPRTVKLAMVSGKLVLKLKDRKVVKYWKVRYELHFNKYTWDLFLLDIGSYYFEGGRDATLLSKKPFMVKGVPTLGLLTSDGDKSTSISRYNRYRVLDELNFNRLMIPLIW